MCVRLIDEINRTNNNNVKLNHNNITIQMRNRTRYIKSTFNRTSQSNNTHRLTIKSNADVASANPINSKCNVRV